ncbi:MAG TPA: RNase adapter RapZ, partial [Polyangiaceae bacterium]|nr:RNase adapter RapZ [Polyangiaceae bacterium]
MSEAPMHLVVVTGLSGAGKTTAVNALEDLGYYCVDNLPTPVVQPTLDALRRGGEQKVALGIDVRVRSYLDGASAVLDEIAQRDDTELSILYLDSSEELLARRFNATRRPHPLTASGRTGVLALLDGIRLERQLLAPLRARARAVLDTTNLTVHDLRREVLQIYGRDQLGKMLTRIVSFGFKFGSPHDADLVFDVRFLPNPYFVEELRPLSGRDAPVANYVMEQPDTLGFIERLLPLLEFCLPRFEAEGKSYVTIAIGCTGGRHRSVALAELIAAELRSRVGGTIEAVHRDMGQAEHRSVRPEAEPTARAGD